MLVEDFKGIPTIDFMTLGKNVWNFIFLNMDQIKTSWFSIDNAVEKSLKSQKSTDLK